MKKILLMVTLLLPWGVVLPSGVTPVQAESLGTGVIVDLLEAGISEASIRRYVERNRFRFDPTAEELKMLKQAGASDELILFLQTGPSETEPPRPATQPDSGIGKNSEESSDADGEVYPGDYGIGYGAPAYYYPDFYYGLDFYYPIFYGGYYYHYPYYSYYPTYGYWPYYWGERHRHGGTGVVSYWHRGHRTESGRVSRGGRTHRGRSHGIAPSSRSRSGTVGRGSHRGSRRGGRR